MTRDPARSLYTFPSDLVDEGVGPVLERSKRLGIDTLTIAMAYHQARDVVPHGGDKPRIRYRRDGVFFTPNPAIWSGSRLMPSVQSADEIGAVDALLGSESCPSVEAWTVFLHNTGLGERHPDVTTKTCFGDRILSNLCPSHPDVASYALRLAGDISSQGIDIVAEALSAQTFAHGHHHERSFTPVSEGDEALLALCFCEHCTAPMNASGGDSDRLAARTRERVQSAFTGAEGIPAVPDALVEVVGGDLIALLRSRETAVTTLAADVSRVVRINGQRLSFMDLTGAVLGYGNGVPSGAPAADQAWRLAIRPEVVGPHVDSYSILGYARNPDRLATDVASYRKMLSGVPLRVILRPGQPDTDSPEHLSAKVSASLEAGADQVDFYNYGMYDESVLSWIPIAMGQA